MPISDSDSDDGDDGDDDKRTTDIITQQPQEPTRTSTRSDLSTQPCTPYQPILRTDEIPRTDLFSWFYEPNAFLFDVLLAGVRRRTVCFRLVWVLWLGEFCIGNRRRVVIDGRDQIVGWTTETVPRWNRKELDLETSCILTMSNDFALNISNFILEISYL